MRDRVRVVPLNLRLLRLSGCNFFLPFLANFLFLFSIFCLVALSTCMPCLCALPPRGFSSAALHRSQLSSPPACRICYLLALVHLQTARFPWRCPKAGEISTSSGLSFKPIIANAVCSIGHRRRLYPRHCCCVGGCVRRWVPPAQPSSVGRRPGGVRKGYNYADSQALSQAGS